MRLLTCLMLGSLSLGAALCWAPATSAHVRLITPEPRADGNSNEGDLKIGPCGQHAGMNGRTDRITTFEPGASITVSFGEFINHPGYYRIALDVDGDDDFPDATASDPDNVPLSDLTNPSLPVYILQYYTDDLSPGFGEEQVYTTTVTLPAIECDNCTLQVIQFMTDNPNMPNYFQCADLVLSATGDDAGAGGPTSSGAGGMTMTSGAGGTSTTGAGTDTGGTDTGSTAMGGATSTTTGAGTVTGTGTGTGMTSSASATSASSGTTSAGPTTGTTGALDGTSTGVGGSGMAPPTMGAEAEEAGCACRTSSAGGETGFLAAMLSLALFGFRRRHGSLR